MKIGEWSKRTGPAVPAHELSSFHFSAATSFNTSGDAYSLTRQRRTFRPSQRQPRAGRQARPPTASSRPARRPSAHQACTSATPIPLVNAQLVTLSGKRHAWGSRDIAGRITPPGRSMRPTCGCRFPRSTRAWTGSEGQGDVRPSLTPKHSGTVWTTYQLTPQWRVGAASTCAVADAQPQPGLVGARLRHRRPDGRVQLIATS
jgi:catecholate siderophore receptor